MDSILQISIRDYKLINLDEVYKLTDIQYSLYAILSVNRMYFEKPTSDGERVNIKFSDIYNKHQCDLELIPKEEKVEFDFLSNYPCDALWINDDRIIASDTYVINKKFEREFRIEYIGISEKNLVCDRLSKHSTLQKIMAINMTNHTGKDLYLLLFNPDHFDIRTYGVDDFKDESANVSQAAMDRFIEMFGVSFENTDKVVALLEASLINIFKPEYNSEYKNSSSTKMFQTLDELYRHGFEKSVISIIAKEKDRGEKITFYTDELKVEQEEKNQFTSSMICPFKLSRRVR